MIACLPFSPPARLALLLFRGVCLVAATWALGIAFTAQVRAEVDFDGLFSRGGVLQRGVKVPIFGIGDDGDEVVIQFQNQTVSTKVKDGRWRVELQPLDVGGPYTLTLTGTTNQFVRDLFVGDVWVCGGEANMQMPVQSAEGGSSAAGSSSRKNRALHFYTVRKASGDKRPDINTSKWSEGSGSATVGAFSAIGYFFGRDIQKTTDIPIGLISCNQFSTSAEAWTSRESILADPELKHLVEDAPRRFDTQTPGKLYNGMVSAISDYAIRGVIFYHGESNVERADEYHSLFSLLIADWRKAWNRPDLPFLFVQLAGYKPTSWRPGDGTLAELREAQLQTWKSVPNTAMVVSTDCSDQYSPIPKTKEPIGKRLAFAARVLVYGEKFEYSGPVLREATVSGGVAKLAFDHVGDGLLAKDGKLSGFTIAGADGEFLPATAEIVGNDVLVTNDAVPEPKHVRYNWADLPLGNLFNKDGYPASPFRTELTAVANPPAMKNPTATPLAPPTATATTTTPTASDTPGVKPEAQPSASPSSLPVALGTPQFIHEQDAAGTYTIVVPVSVRKPELFAKPGLKLAYCVFEQPLALAPADLKSDKDTFTLDMAPDGRRDLTWRVQSPRLNVVGKAHLVMEPPKYESSGDQGVIKIVFRNLPDKDLGLFTIDDLEPTSNVVIFRKVDFKANNGEAAYREAVAKLPEKPAAAETTPKP